MGELKLIEVKSFAPCHSVIWGKLFPSFESQFLLSVKWVSGYVYFFLQIFI